MVPREVSAAEVIETHAPGSPRREEGAAGKAPGIAPDHVAKERRSMNTRVRSLPVLFVTGTRFILLSRISCNACLTVPLEEIVTSGNVMTDFREV